MAGGVEGEYSVVADLFEPSSWFVSDEAETVHLIPDGDGSESSKLDLEEVLYALNAFWATLKPVSLSLFLSSMVVVYLQSPLQNNGAAVAYQIDAGEDNSDKLGKSVANALVIVGFIALVTFLLVFLYWARCTGFLLGYMIFSSSLLLGFLGGFLWYTTLMTYELPCDMITFYFILWNFAIVGIISIFFQKGVPLFVTQGYLVCTSVILAWNLSKFDEWTCWALLVSLAFWDLCAVLTPCGPLKMLVGLMQDRNEPIPGLLYEAELPPPPQQFRINNNNSNVASAMPSRRSVEMTSVAEPVQRKNRSSSSVDGRSLPSLSTTLTMVPPVALPVTGVSTPIIPGVMSRITPGDVSSSSNVMVDLSTDSTVDSFDHLMSDEGEDRLPPLQQGNDVVTSVRRVISSIGSSHSTGNYQYADVSLSSDSEHESKPPNSAVQGLGLGRTSHASTHENSSVAYEVHNRSARSRPEDSSQSRNRRPPVATNQSVAEEKQGMEF